MKDKLKLRTKMTLWYTAFTLFVIIAFCAFLYGVVSYELQSNLQSDTTLAMNQIISQIENENGVITFEDEVPFSSDITFYVTEENGSELASYGSDITQFDSIQINENNFTNFHNENGDWLVLDSSVEHEDFFSYRVRVVASCKHNNEVLSLLLMLFCIGIPFVATISLLIGLTISKRSLLPIKKIINSAKIIAKGNLSERIPNSPVKDELGELTDALNNMLSSVESSFNREKHFSSDASHELRTPITVIRAYTETLLKDKNISENQIESLTTILTECIRMEKIINQLLLITRGQENRYTLQIETIDISILVDSVVASLEDKLEERNITFSQHIPSEITINADQSLITQLLINVIDNAIKYGKQNGTIDLTITQSTKETSFYIKDNGIGIPKESTPYIFDRFYRADPSHSIDGNGLGLSIVKWIVDVHKGNIYVDSKPNIGTTFTINFPLLKLKQ